MNVRICMVMLLIMLSFAPSDAYDVYPYTSTNMVIGSIRNYTIKGDESLIELARRFKIGYNEITEANPGFDPFIPGDGKEIIVPTLWILPDIASYDGIVINLSEKRLYHFSTRTPGLVRTYPVGIGDEGTETPEGVFTVVDKKKNPSWYVPESIRQERPELPRVVPPGPDNPLGTHALRLSSDSILIHGTNRPYAVGRKASHGCIRLYPEDIQRLFQAVPPKTKVTIVRQPVKVGLSKDRVYLEVHKDADLEINYFDEAVKLLRKKNLYERTDKDKMLTALKEKRGFPVDITVQESSGPKNEELL
jgi:L,D-transpeptidase ErfK/SrfK